MNKFTISCTSDKIWNYNELLNFLIANQHNGIELNIEPEAICLETLGLYDLLDRFTFSQIKINTHNPLEYHKKYNLCYGGVKYWFTKIETIDPALHSWNQTKIFYCLFGRPTASRLGLAAHIYKKYKDNSHIHFSATTDLDELHQIELDKLLQYDINSIESAGTIIKKLPLLLSSPNLYTKYNGYVFADPLTNFYKDIFVDILSESHVLGNTFFPTEKTIRPMWLKKPFIAFASKNYLCYLRQMGFRTFGDFWDETYDGYEGKDRYLKILTLIDTIANKSKTELNEMYWNMKYTLDYNYNLLATQSYTTIITKINE